VLRFEQDFLVKRRPEVVFDYLTNPANLADWQTSKTSVEQLTDGPPGPGTRLRERTRQPGGREFDQIVEFTAFERPRLLHTHIVEGPYPVDGTWTFTPEGGGTRVHFVAEGELRGITRMMGGALTTEIMRRVFAGYHRNLRRNVEAA
jgi:uncharacterized protein YndB with AHSA1/START domain